MNIGNTPDLGGVGGVISALQFQYVRRSHFDARTQTHVGFLQIYNTQFSCEKVTKLVENSRIYFKTKFISTCMLAMVPGIPLGKQEEFQQCGTMFQNK